jgi:hypothetical protein
MSRRRVSSSSRVTADLDLDLATLDRQVRPLLRRRGARITRRIATEARAKVPVKTGNLGRSIEEEPMLPSGPFRVSGGVIAKAKYAKFVHDGTSPHLIRPKNGRYLVFPGRSGGMVFARSVRHPGTRARPFLANAATKIIAEETRR